MKIVLAGAFGKLGSDILRALCQTEHEIIAADAVVNVPGDLDESRFTTRKIDVTLPPWPDCATPRTWSSPLWA